MKKWNLFVLLTLALLLSLCACQASEEEPLTHTVKLDHDYLNQVQTLQVADGATIDVPYSYERAGYENTGWLVWESGAWREWNFEQDTVDRDLTLKQQRTPRRYTLKLRYEDGTGRMDEVTVTYGEEYTLPTPTREGYLFLGWYHSGKRVLDSGRWLNENTVSYRAAWSPFGYETTVLFGAYEQDNDRENGAEPIEWLILDRSENQDAYLLLSRYVIEYMPYHDAEVVLYRSYRDRTLRTWLNEDFYKEAFGAEERRHIRKTHLDDVNTDDHVFLLNYDEIGQTLLDARYGIGIASDYVMALGFTTENMYGGYPSYPYWVRYGDTGQMYAQTIGYGGGSRSGSNIGHRYLGVRPAIWVDADCVNAQLSTQAK